MWIMVVEPPLLKLLSVSHVPYTGHSRENRRTVRRRPVYKRRDTYFLHYMCKTVETKLLLHFLP